MKILKISLFDEIDEISGEKQSFPNIQRKLLTWLTKMHKALDQR